MNLRRSCFAFASVFSFVSAGWHFRSRPDFNSPRLNITIGAGSNAVEDGLIFVAPYAAFTPESDHTGPVQPGAYIFQSNGELVWSGVGYHAGWVANFVPDTWNGKQYLRAFQGRLDIAQGRMFGFLSLLDGEYRVAKTVIAGSHKWVSAHEFNLQDGKTALIEVPVEIVVSLKPWGGDETQNYIVSSGFQEIEIETNKVVFEWYSFDHVDPKYSAFPLDVRRGLPGSGRNESNGWNYFHINSVDKDDEGNYLISARHIAAVYKINGTSGDIIWQLGGLRGGSDFEIKEEDEFAFQHHARFRGRSADGSKEVISLFDNSAYHVPESAPIKTYPYSRGRIYEIDHNKGTARALRTYNPPEFLSAPTQGSLQVLPSGNIFINWGEAGGITEYSYDGEVLFHARLDTAPDGVLVQSYRGFKANWTGTPAEDPAVVAFKSRNGPEVDVYVSWNGDTESRAWRFYAVSGSDQIATERSLGEVRRSGFETKATFEIDNEEVRILAEAVDKGGNVLRRTRIVEVGFDTGYETQSPSLLEQWTGAHEPL